MFADPVHEDLSEMSLSFPSLRDNVVKVLLELKAEMEQWLVYCEFY